jgi:hypothetical protein
MTDVEIHPGRSRESGRPYVIPVQMTHPIFSTDPSCTQLQSGPPCPTKRTHSTAHHTAHTTHTSSRVCTPCLSLCLFSVPPLSLSSNMSNLLADSLASSAKDGAVDKPKDSLAKIVSPPHFGDLGKAANDLFSKVPGSPSHPSIGPHHRHQLPLIALLSLFLLFVMMC